MKSKFFTNIIIEGCDGVGKSTLKKLLLKHYTYTIPVYDRGEFSNFIYAKKYNRLFSAMQRHLPILFILLTADKNELKNRIIKRGKDENWKQKDLDEEIEKISDQDLFIKYKTEFIKDYHLIEIDTTNKTPNEVLNEIVILIDEYQNKLKIDSEENFTFWNKLYLEGCKKLGLEFKVINNQPFINNKAIMGEINLHNGIYETFSDKRCPHNLIYCLAYNQNPKIIPFEERKEDFTYIVNSKILTRHEIYDYLDKFVENNLTCLVGKDTYFSSNPLIKTCERPVGDDLINKIMQAKASVYIARRMEYLKYVSVRLYENIIAQNIIFVDKLSDKDCEILKQIHKDDENLINLLYVDENTICENYNKIKNDKQIIEKIINNQNKYYEKIKKELFENVKENRLFI